MSITPFNYRYIVWFHFKIMYNNTWCLIVTLLAGKKRAFVTTA